VAGSLASHATDGLWNWLRLLEQAWFNPHCEQVTTTFIDKDGHSHTVASSTQCHY
jgi:hypothetical protein